MKGIRYRLISSGKRIFCNLKNDDIKILESIDFKSKKINNGKTRAGTVSNQFGKVYAFTDEKTYLISSKKFNTELNSLLNSINYISESIDNGIESYKQNINRIIHNVITANAHNVQEFFLLFPQNDISRRVNKKQISYIKKIVDENSKEVSKALLKIAKNNTAMKIEFSIFQKLYNKNTRLEVRLHNVHRVIMNILYIFFADFTDKDVYVQVSESKCEALFDYESFHVILYHMIENATKYIKPNSKLIINIECNKNNFVQINLEMISLEIKDSERELIFEEGYSGDAPTKIFKNGKGLGLNIVSRLVELNNGKVDVLIDEKSLDIDNGFRYQKNIFLLQMPIE